MKTALWWVRRDLRLSDNPALQAALSEAERVLPVFVLDPGLLESVRAGAKRKAFLFGGLRELAADLERRGSGLVVREGPPERALGQLVEETGAGAIFAEQDVSPYARRRDGELQKALPLRGVWGVSFLTPRQALKENGEPYTTFTPYRRVWKREAASRMTAPASWEPPARLPTPERPTSVPIPSPELPAEVPFVPGERAAGVRLSRFLAGPVYRYGEERNRLDLDGTSRLSPYLRFGMVSARRAVASAWKAIETAPGKAERKGAEVWLDELVWREFYLSILYHHPRVRRESFRPLGDAVSWRDDPDQFQAWCEGRTGYPVVDAAMRELVTTGFIHNRARMIVASFLTKHLLVDWRLGERFFMQHLVDGDPAANNGGWQWTAGTGTDAAPYFRIFNPVLQGKRFDPEGKYLRRWLPELDAERGEALHEPRRPIVSHTMARVRALAAFDEAKAALSADRRADRGGTRGSAST